MANQNAYYTAPLSANKPADNSKQAAQLSQRAALPALCSGIHSSLLKSSIKMSIHRMAKDSL